jgi:hypothetical protein
MAKIKYTWAKDPEDYLLQRIDRKGEDECWLWQSAVDRDGYGQCHASPQAQKLQVTRAHQMAYVTCVGPIPDGMVVCHHCDTPSCCNPSHLFVGTVADNNADKVKKGRAKSGRKREVDYDAIVALYGVMPCEEVANKFECSFSLVCSIWRKHGLHGRSFIWNPITKQVTRKNKNGNSAIK